MKETEGILMLNDKKWVVREANELIEASYRFDVWEDRIFLLTLSQIKFQDEDFKEYKIYIRDLANKYGIKTHDVYTLVKNAVESLRKKKITIPYRFGEDVGTFSTGLLASYGAVDKEDLSYIIVELHPKLKPYLIQLKERFTQYNITFLMKMQSSHSKRIYKLLKQFEKIGKRTFTIEKLREILGIEEDEYKQYYDFKRRFILKAQADLKKYTDLSFTFKEDKQGKRVHTITFKIQKNNVKKEEVEDIDFFALGEDYFKPTITKAQLEMYLVVAVWGISEEVFERTIQDKSDKQIQTCIKITQENKNVKDKAAYWLALMRKEDVKDGKDINMTDSKLEEVLVKQEELLKETYDVAMHELKRERYNREQSIIQGLLMNAQMVAAAKEIACTKRMNGYNEKLSFEDNYSQNRMFKIATDQAVMQIRIELFQPIWDEYEAAEKLLKQEYKQL